MRLARTLVILLVLCLAGLPRAYAQADGSPYTVIVPVNDMSEATRDSAFSTALAQVLARVAGGQDLRGKPGYADALQSAAGIVKNYQYNRAGSGASLSVSFDQAAVQHAIAAMGVVSAGVKPPVLAVIRGASGKLLDKDALAALAQGISGGGYALVLPDAGSSPDSAVLAQADPAALATVAAHYHTGLVLIGQLDGQDAHWTLVSGGQPQAWSDHAASRDALLADAGNTLAARLGQQLNVIASGGDVSGTLWVSGIDSAMDYAGVLALLRADPSVHQVITAAADGDGMLFKLRGGLPMDALAANLAASGHLLKAPTHPGADASLRWLR